MSDRCSICDEPISLCQCTENASKVLGARLGGVMHQELARALRMIPMEDRVLFFSGFMATCLGHMKVAIGVEAAKAVIDALKVLADSDARIRSASTRANKEK